MNPRETICVVLIVSCSVCVTTALYKNKQNWDWKANDDEGDDSLIRGKRASHYHLIGKPVLEGIAAVKKLLRGARTMKEGNAGFQRFSKLGSYEKALKDFNRLRPKSTNEIQGPNGEKIVTGVKGDREFVLTKADADKPNKATIEVKKLWELNGEKSGRTTHKIVYQ